MSTGINGADIHCLQLRTFFFFFCALSLSCFLLSAEASVRPQRIRMTLGRNPLHQSFIPWTLRHSTRRTLKISSRRSRRANTHPAACRLARSSRLAPGLRHLSSRGV
ncbi:hypothetical protein ACQKWADRAFT_284155 [Trichoderma austrokoningii]